LLVNKSSTVIELGNRPGLKNSILVSNIFTIESEDK
jgi:hypothetical protein